MEETPNNQENSATGRLIYLINRDTGEILLFNHYFVLDFQSNIVFKLENNTIIPVCSGRFENDLWHFRGMGIMISHQDRLVAAFKVLYNGYKYKIMSQRSKVKSHKLKRRKRIAPNKGVKDI